MLFRSMYGSFSNFQNVVHQSQFEDQWYYDSAGAQYVYYAKIEVDTISIDYAWGVDSVVNSAVNELADAGFGLYPNPTNGMVTVDVSSIQSSKLTIKVTDLVGREVYSAGRDMMVKTTYINTQSWPAGTYVVTITTDSGRYTRRLIKD